MKRLLKSFRAGQTAKVLFLSLALTGAMSVFNAQAQLQPMNVCRFDGEECKKQSMGCVCITTPNSPIAARGSAQ
jgi:hypothetical protein